MYKGLYQTISLAVYLYKQNFFNKYKQIAKLEQISFKVGDWCHFETI